MEVVAMYDPYGAPPGGPCSLALPTQCVNNGALCALDHKMRVQHILAAAGQLKAQAAPFLEASMQRAGRASLGHRTTGLHGPVREAHIQVWPRG
jgi:hypothetical protein